ncbi:hypothetical protein KKE03_04170 [Patescibacteria group bacterium]|nr:hypothetical protein [Patescibacteria group bacterium]
MKKLFIIFSLLLLIYMLWPGPGKISDFKPLPSSIKSTLSGDTVEIPNVAGYFSDNYRQFVTSFYKSNYWQKTFLPFPPIRLNHPPEYSWTAIKKHTDSTYFEEFVYPLRDSFYVNGFEPFYENFEPKFWGSSKFEVENRSFYTKTTLRFYPSSKFTKFLVWLGVVTSIYWLFKLGKKIIV